MNRVLVRRRLQLEALPYDWVDPDGLGDDVFTTPLSCLGIDFRARAQRALLEEIVTPFREEAASWPHLPVASDPDAYFLGNRYFGPVDAEVYYGLLRSESPSRVLEVGGGNSTRLARLAIDDGDTGTSLTSIDPDPRAPVARVADEHLVAPVQDVALARFEELEAGDMLFIDSSHKVVTGGDLPFLFFEVLPRLATNVLVHVHDIHLPMPYPRLWIIEQRRGYNEEYLLGAYLSDNPGWEIVWSSQWMLQNDPAGTRAAFPNLGRVEREYPGEREVPALPGSFWMRRR